MLLKGPTRAGCLVACLAWVVIAPLVSGDVLKDALARIDKSKADHLVDLKALVGFPSVSALPIHANDLLAAAAWLEQRLKKAGMQHVEILNTTGPQPVVFGHYQGSGTGPGGGRRPVLLVYAHYDVQPVDPLEEWESPPFEVTQKGSELYGRGVDDDKGGLLQAVHAVEALVGAASASGAPLPLDIKFMLEGQEEILSPHLRPFLEAHTGTLACDLVLSADGGQISETQGGVALGLRGVLGAEVEVATAGTDMHSGMKGGSVANPNSVLARLLAGLHDPATSRVAVPGFYEGVSEPSAQDEADMSAYGWDEPRERAALGVLGWAGEEGYSTLARRWHRPTLEVVGMSGGFTGPGIKTVIPRAASAKLSARLVPGQDPDDVYAKVRAHLLASAPPYANVTVTRLGGSARPWTSPRGGAGNTAAARVLERVMGRPAKYLRDGATIPALADFTHYLGAPVTKFGWGLGDHIHAPNERLKVAMWEKGSRAWVQLLWELAHDPALAAEVAARGPLPAGAPDEARKDEL